jgi:hypothetical protein
MRVARSFFLSLVCVATAIPLFAADNQASAQPSPEQQTSQTLLPGEASTTPFDMLVLRNRSLVDSAQPVVARQFIPSTDRACLTLRIYKVKRTERLADGQTATRGYTTCEVASNYQMRSAVAHARVDDSDGTREK